MSTREQEHIARLRWHCRRGMLELDALLLPFCDKVYPELNQQQQQAFADLLQQEDTILFTWLMGHEQPSEGSLMEIVSLIRKHGQART